MNVKRFFSFRGTQEGSIGALLIILAMGQNGCPIAMKNKSGTKRKGMLYMGITPGVAG
ncbi:hypothetical protein ABIA45_001654 [Bradyrhizobium sp. USDA 336]